VGALAKTNEPDLGLWPGWALFRPPSWSSDRTSVAANTARDIVREVLTAVTGLATLGPPAGVVWRGQARTDWRVDSGLGRAVPDGAAMADWEQHERAMLDQARRVGADNAQHQGDLELLARLRHHGAATRLIDFTQDPMVALWFACTDDDYPETDDHDGVLAVLDRGSVEELRDPWKFRYDNIGDGGETVHLATLTGLDPRITAQRGLFVFAARPRSADECALAEIAHEKHPKWRHSTLERVCSPSSWAGLRGQPPKNFPDLMGIVVPAVVKPTLRDILRRTYGFTRTTMYPDFPGLALSFKGYRPSS